MYLLLLFLLVPTFLSVDVCMRDCIGARQQCIAVYGNYSYSTDYMTKGLLLDSDGIAELYNRKAFLPIQLPIGAFDVCKGTYSVINCQLLMVRLNLNCMTTLTYTDMYEPNVLVTKLMLPRKTWQYLDVVGIMQGEYLELVEVKYYLVTKTINGGTKILEEYSYPPGEITLPKYDQ